MIDKKLSEEMILKYGENIQLDIVIEEYSEVIKEIVKYKRQKTHKEHYNMSHLAEELADVLVVNEILFNVLNEQGITRKQIEQIAKSKQDRTRERYLKEK